MIPLGSYSERDFLVHFNDISVSHNTTKKPTIVMDDLNIKFVECSIKCPEGLYVDATSGGFPIKCLSATFHNKKR